MQSHKIRESSFQRDYKSRYEMITIKLPVHNKICENTSWPCGSQKILKLSTESINHINKKLIHWMILKFRMFIKTLYWKQTSKNIELDLDSKELVSKMHRLSLQIQMKRTKINRKIDQRLEQALHKGECPNANKCIKRVLNLNSYPGLKIKSTV